MATEFPFFVNRQEELEIIQRAIAEVGKRQVVLAHGPGGIGKTRLLQKVREYYASASSLTMSGILDAYELELRVPIGWEYRVARQIDRYKAFADFGDEYRGWLDEESRGVSPETLARARERVREAFVQGFNRVAAQERVVLLLDTVEEIQKVGALWPHLLDLMTRLDNVVWIIASRRCDEVRAAVETRMGVQNMHWLGLKGFDQKAAGEYFDEYFKKPSVVSLD